MVLSTTQITNEEFKKYDVIDESLISGSSKDFIRNFGQPEDYIEAHIYTQDGTLIFSDYNVKAFNISSQKSANSSSLTDTLEFDPGTYIESLGYTAGTFDIEYNILRKKIFNSAEKIFYIKEISADRKEIRVTSNFISNSDIQNGTANFIYEFQTSPYFKDFELDFGDNKLVTAVNIALDINTNPFSILIKLYQPLPDEFQIKSSFWFVEELSKSYIFRVEIFPELQPEKVPMLKGPNFDLDVEVDAIRSSEYINIDELLSYSSTGSYQNILNRLNNPGISINVDYTDYANFIHFSSATERLLNFKYKLSLIEEYQSNITTLQNVTGYSQSANFTSSYFILQDKINNIIQNFDGYESFLYFESHSTSWPKSGSKGSYVLYGTTSSTVVTWLGSDDNRTFDYGGQLSSASLYDNNNQDNLIFSVPGFITDDPANDDYSLFLNMLGQHFDNIWIYIKSITDLYKNQNNLSKGISKDLVFQTLRSLGVKLYNDNSNQNIFNYFLGVDSSGSYFPITSSYQTLVTASSTYSSGEDQQKELYKRIYHNVSSLLKSKGTARGIKTLISTFGIPDTILDVTEFGGSDKSSETIEYSYDRFTYSLYNTGSSYLRFPWLPLTQNSLKYNSQSIVPDSIEFRFKPDKLDASVPYSSSILFAIEGTQKPSFGINLEYSSSNGLPYGKMTFIISGSNNYLSASFGLPIYVTGSDGDTFWWDVLLRRRFTKDVFETGQTQTYDLFVKNEIDGRIGHQASCSITTANSGYNTSWYQFGSPSSSKYLVLGGCPSGGLNVSSSTGIQVPYPFISNSTFVGHFQEFRYWSAPLSESAFNYHVLNPNSIQGNNSSSAFDDLAARFTLGNNLKVYNHYLTTSIDSTHPDFALLFASGSYLQHGYGFGLYGEDIYGFTGSHQIFETNTASAFNFLDEINYDSFTEQYYSNTPNSVYAAPITQKIRIIDTQPSGSVLSPFLRLEDPEDDDIYLTKDIHFTDVSFSPQNLINRDIINQYGNTINIDDLIGNPQDDDKDFYPDLISLKNAYYEKFFSKFNYRDFINLIQYFNNSLFKMIKDFVPARTNIQTGITFKSHILERPKIKRQVFNLSSSEYTSSIVVHSLSSSSISADSVYTSSYSDGRDFFTGELSGSEVDVSNYYSSSNPYLTYDPNINITKFVLTDYNPLLNVVTASRLSSKLRTFDFITSSITYPAELQDGYYTYKRHILPRYLGCKSTSQLYNFYTDGDESYGKNAAIDINTFKFAWINEINERNFNFYDKTNVNIKYLIDASSSVTELSRKNDNIFEVQNIFKSRTYCIVSLIDPMNPTVQTALDGQKLIWEGGFSYSPIVYREINETLYFTLLVPLSYINSSLGIKAICTSSLEWLTANSTHDDFATVPDEVNTFFKRDGVSVGATAFSLVKTPASNWPYSNIPLNTNGPYLNAAGQYFYDSNPQVQASSNFFTLDWILAVTTGSAQGGYCTSDFNDSITVNTSGEKYIIFTAPRQSTYKINLNQYFKVQIFNENVGWSTCKMMGIIEKKVNGQWTYLAKTNMTVAHIPTGDGAGVGVDATHDAIFVDGNMNGTNPFVEVNLHIDNLSISLNQNDQLRLIWYFAEMRSVFVDVSAMDFIVEAGDATQGFFEIYDTVTSITTPITTGSIGSSPAFFYLDTDHQTLVFNDSASLFYSQSKFIAPSPGVSNNISEYYSPVIYPFYFQLGDIVRFTSYFAINPEYYNISFINDPIINYTGGTPSVITPLKVKLDRQVSSGSIDTENFAFLRREADETNVILQYNKSEGKTSSGVLIPLNILPSLKSNVPNIVGPLKDKLLAGVLVIGG